MKKGTYIEVETEVVALSTIPEGGVVVLNEDNSPVLFYIAKHNYESGLNGDGRTLLARLNFWPSSVFYNSLANTDATNAYAASGVDVWLNETYKLKLDNDIRSLIGETKFYYTPGGSEVTVSTLSRSVFLLSISELGLPAVNSSNCQTNVEGSELPIADILLGPYESQGTLRQLTRTPNKLDASKVVSVSVVGGVTLVTANSFSNVRPCFTLPSTTAIQSNRVVVARSINEGTNVIAPRKAKKGYIGIDNIARELKRIYYSVDNIARSSWAGDPVEYCGTPISLTEPNLIVYSCSPVYLKGGYALFAGGGFTSNATTAVEAFDKNLVKREFDPLTVARSGVGVTSVGKYGIIAGGNKPYNSSSTTVNTVDAYDMHGTLTTPSALATARNTMQGATVGEYGLLSGGAGTGYNSDVVTYNTGLTRSTAPSMSHARNDHFGVSTGKYALFGGGYDGINKVKLYSVDAYDSSLTKIQLAPLSVAKHCVKAAMTNTYAVVFGGINDNSKGDQFVEAYDRQLTKIFVGLRPAAVNSMTQVLEVSFNGYALFGNRRMVCYDDSLVAYVLDDMVAGRINGYKATGVALGDYALFGGGNSTYPSIDVYKINKGF